MKELLEWDAYGDIVSVSNSIRKYYGLTLLHDSDSDLDQWLQEKKPYRIIVLLIDAMGESVIHKHLKESDFFISHEFKSITTVFPPTTSAATTSLRTGMYPCETGWLGWDQYFKEKDDEIILFLNRSQYHRNTFYPNFSYQTLPPQFIGKQLQDAGIGFDSVWPEWGKDHPSKSYSDMMKNILKVSRQKDTRCIYAYWDALDTFMHIHGPSSEQTGFMVRQIERETKEMASHLSEDTALLVIADHSQIDIKQRDITKEKDLISCFRHEPSLEPRTMAFYIWKDKRKQFEDTFHSLFDGQYHLYTKEEVIEGHFFGKGKEHKRFKEFTGDYLGVAENDMQLAYRIALNKKGDHAGRLKAEAMIPLILYKK